MADEPWRMSAVEAVARLRKREISPLELVEASAQHIGKPRGGAALLQVAALFEPPLALDRLLPIDPRPGSVPPAI